MRTGLQARAWWIAGTYLAVAILWIVFSDQILGVLVSDPDVLVQLSVVKGLGFVVLTAGLLLQVLRRTFGQIATTLADLRIHEAENERIGRLYAAQTAINQAIVRTSTREELLHESCHALVERGGFAMAWVGWLDAERATLTPGAVCGDDGGYLDEVTVRTDEGPEGRGPSGVALRDGAPYICNDTRTDPLMRQWRSAVDRHGFRACADFPVRRDGVIHGMLNVYAREPGFFQAEEVALLTDVAADISFALDNLERTAERDEARAIAQREMSFSEAMQTELTRAEAADRVKSAFLATMSHELRTPLNSIIGFTGIVLQGLAGPLTDEQTTQLGMVRTSARHLLALINDVLDISKIEAGQLQVRCEPFDLAATVDRATATIQPAVDAKGLALHTVVPADIGVITGDHRRVEQILLNLLSNAVKFTDTGGVTLIAQHAPDHRPADGGDPRPVIQLRVCDTGIGISPGDMAKLFQPFRQLDSGIARQHEGTGLGLAICRRLAALMGGEVTATSEPSVGSEFTLTIPCDDLRPSRSDDLLSSPSSIEPSA